MENVNLAANYFSDKKASRLRARLDDKSDVYPVRLWCFCAKQLHHECLAGYLPEEIEEQLLWRGKAGDLVKLLASKEIGALELKKCAKLSKPHFHAHGFNEHNGHILALHKRAVRGAKARWSATRNGKS